MNQGDGVCAKRRRWLAGIGAGVLAGLLPETGMAIDGPPEVARLRIVHGPSLCFAPNYVAEAFLRLEGFSEVEYVKIDESTAKATVEAADMGVIGGPGLLPSIDSGLPITVLAGIHMGCWELYAHNHVRAIRNLRGKRIPIVSIGSVDHAFITSIMAYVGINPRTEIDWVISGRLPESMRLFEEGKVDAFLAFPPQPQDLRLKKIGHVLVNTTTDRPWSHYFCCMLLARREFVRRYPVATKRALRAILKAADVCADQPEQAAKLLVERGHESRYDVALEVLKSLPYDAWRHVDPTDTIRFHANRLYDVGMIKMTPQKILEQGTDFRFLNEIRREMKT